MCQSPDKIFKIHDQLGHHTTGVHGKTNIFPAPVFAFKVERHSLYLVIATSPGEGDRADNTGREANHDADSFVDTRHSYFLTEPNPNVKEQTEDFLTIAKLADIFEAMSRNGLIVAALVLAVIVGGIYLNRRNNRNLPDGSMSQSNPNPTSEVTPGSLSTRPRTTLKTDKGDIVIELRPDLAPTSVANYLGRWTNGDCEGLTFHRVEDWVIQGCDPKGDGTGGNTSIPTESSSEPFTAGSVGVARMSQPADRSNDHQFFIVKKDSFHLNGQYTYLGKVVSGMDVVNQIMVGDKIQTSTVVTK